MDERTKADLAAIKEREAAVRRQIAEGAKEVDMGPFTLPQLGLSVAVVDRWGHLWRVEGQKLVKVVP